MATANEDKAVSKTQPLFSNLSADDDENTPTEIESLCMNCGDNGMTRLLLTRIPLFREVILSSFHCQNCGYSNNETTFGGSIRRQGVKISALVINEKDLSRQVVRSDYSTVLIPELELEIPPISKKGEVNTIEGILDKVVVGLEQDQEYRKETCPDDAKKIEDFITRLKETKMLKLPFHLVIDDPSGNSFIENLFAPLKDDQLETDNYDRTTEQNEMLGISGDNETDVPIEPENLKEEVLQFRLNCSNCNAPCDTKMKVTKIPHFKECVIMATDCDSCGHRTNEVKSGAGIEPLGTKITVTIKEHVDLTRDVLKSETCGLKIPDLDFEVGSGAHGGKFTTIEGLLGDIKEHLSKNNPFVGGDSAQPEMIKNLDDFNKKLDEIIEGKRSIKLILDDPCGNSYVQSLSDDRLDDRLERVQYERSFEQNEEMGLNDMKTDNY